MRRMKTHFNIEGYERQKTRNMAEIMKNVEKDEQREYSPLFESYWARGFIFQFQMIGIIILAANLVIDTLYFSRSIFSSSALYNGYLAWLVIRFFAPFLSLIYYCLCQVYEDPDYIAADSQLKSKEAREKDEAMETKGEKRRRCLSWLLYTTMPMAYLTGFYRIFNFKNFHREISRGIYFDLSVAAAPFLVL